MFDGYIRDHACWTPRAPAVVTPRRAYSYADFDADIDRFAGGLEAEGLTPAVGVVSVCLDDPYLTCVITAALARLRIASSPFNDPGAAVRLIDRPGAGDDGPGPQVRLLEREWIAAVRAGPAPPRPILEAPPEGLGRVMLSSGTTQAPRRVAMTWSRIEAGNLANIRTYAAGARGLFVPLTSLESMLGFTMAVAAWSLGCPVSAGVGPSEVAAAMEARPEGLIGCTPAQLRATLAALPAGFAPRPGWRLLTAGSLLPAPLAREARLSLTPDVRIIYGATESSLNAVGLAQDLEHEPAQVGITPGGALLEIVGDDGRPVTDGESGEIRVRSSRMTVGYLDDPAATAERFRDGWFLSRDIGRRLPDGRIVLEGRADDRMNLGGIKFMPQVLEDAAFACPGVVDCAAFGVPDAAGNDQCWLAVVMAPGADRDLLAPHLAGWPQRLPPPSYAWTDEIPRNAMGKAERSKLRAAVLAAIRGAV